MLFRWIGGSLGGVAGTGVVMGTVMIVFGMTPGEVVVHMVAEMPDWIFGDWFKLNLVVVGLFLIWASLKFNVWSRRQEIVDQLSQEIKRGIDDLLNKRVQNDQGLGELQSDMTHWENGILALLKNNRAYFSLSDQIHFETIGQVPEETWKHEYRANPNDGRHRLFLNILSIKFDRLRDIVNWTQQRTR